MKKTFFFSNRLDDSTGLVKVNHNNVMQTVSPTTKTPWFLRIQEAINLRGLARAFGLGLLCGEPNEVTQSAENAPQTAMEQKTPLNRIGLGKKAIIAVLALATMMTTSSAMALHPVVVWIYGWVSGQFLTRSAQALINEYSNAEESIANVNGAYWSSNYYKYTLTGDGAGAITPLGIYRSIVARQGHELTGTARGTRDGVAMEEEEAEGYLQTQGRYIIVSASGYAENDDEDTVLVMWMSAREYYFPKWKDKVLATIQELHDDPSYEWLDDLWVKHTDTHRVENHRMTSNFNNPNAP